MSDQVVSTGIGFKTIYAEVGKGKFAPVVVVVPGTDPDGAGRVRGLIGEAFKLPANATGGSVSAQRVSSECARVSLRAKGSDLRFGITSLDEPETDDTQHFIAMGERLEFPVEKEDSISVISDTDTPGVLEISEING